MSDLVDALRNGVHYLRSGSIDRALHVFRMVERTSADPAVRSEALRRQADVKRRRAEWNEALRLAAEAEALAVAHGLADHAAAALNIAGTIHLQQGEYERATEVYRSALEREPGAREQGMICQNLGTVAAQRGQHEEAADWYARSAAAFQAAGCLREQTLALSNQGNLLLDQGRLADAEAIYRSALRHLAELPERDAELEALVAINLAETLARRSRELEEAFDLTLRAMGYFAAASNHPHRLAGQRVFALVAEAQGHQELALGAVERGLELAYRIGSTPEIAHFERELHRLRATCLPPTPDSGPRS